MRFHIGLSLNWKTIKKWLIPIGIGIALFLGYSSMTVYAEEVQVSSWRLDVNNKQLTAGKFNTYSAGYVYYNLTANTVIDMTELSNFQKTFYFRYTVCSDSDSSGGWSETSWVENVKFERTNITCSYTGSSYTGGRIQYITFQGIPPTQAVDPATTSDLYVVWGNLVVANYYSASSLELINFEIATTPFVSDPIDQTIINQNQQQIDEQKKTNEKLDDLKEQQEESNKNQEEIKDAITDSTVDKDTGNSFFDNFSTEDNGGISGIITAPLTLINSLLDNQGTCADLEFPILGKDVSMPSGCIIWDKVPTSIETIIQMLVCGTGAYFILTKLFKDINDLKDPNKQGVSTLDL